VVVVVAAVLVETRQQGATKQTIKLNSLLTDSAS
jgi:hypothetical protein